MTRHASSPSTATHGLRNRSRPQSSKRRHSKLSSPRVRDASWPTRRPNLAPLRPDASPSVSTSELEYLRSPANTDTLAIASARLAADASDHASGVATSAPGRRTRSNW
jgi:hypothetical protein